jgi:hypothetical protein
VGVTVGSFATDLMRVVVQVSPAQRRAGKFDEAIAQLEAGTRPSTPGKWRVHRALEMQPVGLLRQLQLELEPLDDTARETARRHVAREQAGR